MEYKYTYDGIPIQVSNIMTIKYKETVITYHTPIYLPKHIKRYNYKQIKYIKKEIDGYDTFVVGLPYVGKVIMMHGNVFDKLKKSGLVNSVK